jgi:hypothetical protein
MFPLSPAGTPEPDSVPSDALAFETRPFGREKEGL